MRIVIPISSHDQSMVGEMASILEGVGGLENHVVTIIPQLSQTHIAKELCSRLLLISKNATVEAMPVDLPADNWPRSPNNQFQFSAYKMLELEQMPWLWMELDAKPLKREWADRIEVAYHTSRKPYMGNIVPTPFRTDQGVFIEQPGDMMMMGVGVYHPMLARQSGLIRDLRIDATGAEFPWNTYMRWELHNLGWSDTNLIADMVGTGKYRRDNLGGIQCDHVPGKFPRRPRGGVVADQAVLVHGCKDGTLEKLICEGFKKQDVEQDAATITISSATVAEPVFIDLDEVPTSSVPTREGVVQMLEAKKHRFGEIASIYGMTQEAMKAWLATNGFKIGAGGWVK